MKKLLKSYVNAKIKEEAYYLSTNFRSSRSDDRYFVASVTRAFNNLNKSELWTKMTMKRQIKYLTILQKIVRKSVNEE